MAYKITLLDGLVVEVTTEEEFAAVLRSIQGPRREVQFLEAPVEPPAEQAALEAPALRRFFQGLPENQRTLLQQVAHAEGIVRDAALLHVFGFTTNNQLAGVVAGLSKRGAKAGLTLDQILVREQHHNGAGRYNTYEVTSAMREAMTEL